MEHLITGELDYIIGHLRKAHMEMRLNDEEFEKFKTLSNEEQIEQICNGNSNLIVDGFHIDDMGEVINVIY